jgi:hypothetical protein
VGLERNKDNFERAETPGSKIVFKHYKMENFKVITG